MNRRVERNIWTVTKAENPGFYIWFQRRRESFFFYDVKLFYVEKKNKFLMIIFVCRKYAILRNCKTIMKSRSFCDFFFLKFFQQMKMEPSIKLLVRIE
jgi:hypothetical protein